MNEAKAALHDFKLNCRTDISRAAMAALKRLEKAIGELPDEPRCGRCNGTGWLEPIGPKIDGSYITSRPCPRCDVVRL